MKTLSLHISPDGKPTRSGQQICQWILDETQPGDYWLNILPAKEIRTIKQNAYMWSVLLIPIADYIGCRKEEIHQEFKEHFLGFKTVRRYSLDTKSIVETQVLRSTTELSPKAFSKYCKDIKDIAFYKIGVPFGFEDFDYFIDKHPEIVEQFAAEYVYDKAA